MKKTVKTWVGDELRIETIEIPDTKPETKKVVAECESVKREPKEEPKKSFFGKLFRRK